MIGKVDSIMHYNYNNDIEDIYSDIYKTLFGERYLMLATIVGFKTCQRLSVTSKTGQPKVPKGLIFK